MVIDRSALTPLARCGHQTLALKVSEWGLAFAWSEVVRKRSVSGPVQAAARVALNGCQFQGRSSAMRRAGWSAMRTSTSVR